MNLKRTPIKRKTPIKRGTKRPKKSRKTNRTREADRLFSLLIRGRDKTCQECGTTAYLQCAHGFSRRYRVIRWDPRNAWALCRGCHLRFTVRPLEWDEWLLNRWGAELYAEMRATALNGTVPDLDDVIGGLK